MEIGYKNNSSVSTHRFDVNRSTRQILLINKQGWLNHTPLGGNVPNFHVVQIVSIANAAVVIQPWVPGNIQLQDVLLIVCPDGTDVQRYGKKGGNGGWCFALIIYCH